MYLCLAKVRPLDRATGSRVDVYLSSFGWREHALVNGLGSQKWEPAILAPPAFGMQFWNGDFTAPVDPGLATNLALNLATAAKEYPSIASYIWPGAPIELYVETPATAWPWAPRFVGKVDTYQGVYPKLSLAAKVDPEPFEKNVLTSVYAGTGGIEGGADLKNRAKPLVIGWAKNVEPLLIDATNSVYQFSAYGAIEEITTLYERGAVFAGGATADVANYAALVAAVVPPGRYATCKAFGLVRLGAPAFGVITADLKGHKIGSTTPRLPGAMISALATIAGIDTARIEADTIAALDAAAAALPSGGAINLAVTDQVAWIDQAKAIALTMNWQPGITLTGQFFVSSVAIAGSEVLTLDAQGKKSPQAIAVEEQVVSPPYYRTTMGANRSWRVHSPDEIASNAVLNYRGLWDVATTYREGDYVELEDGSQWLYINPVASAGNAPPTWPTTSNAYWENMVPPQALAATLVGYLTNESHTVFALSDGSVPSFTGAGGQFVVAYGGATLTSGVSYSVVSETGVDVSINGSTGVYTVASMSANQGTATLRATYSGKTVDKVYSISKSIQGIDGDDGSDAVSVYLTNETHAVPTNSEGLNGDFTAANGLVKVFNHTGDITAAATISSATASGCTGTVNTATNTPVNGQPKGYYRVTAMSADIATLTIPVTVGLITVNKVFSVTKSKTGAIVVLAADRQTISYDKTGAGNPSVQTVNLTATLTNVAGPVTAWFVSSYSGSFFGADGFITIAGDTLSAQMTRQQFETIAGATRGVKVRVRRTVNGVNLDDVVSITRVQDGADGVDGDDAKAMAIRQDRYGIGYDGNGALSPASQPTTFIAEKINTTATVTWTVKDANGTLRTPVTSYLSSATGDTVQMTAAQFESARNGTKSVTVTATLTDTTVTPNVTLTDFATQIQVSAGASGVGFVQDSPIPTPQFINQTWLMPTSKQWFRWNGSGWVRILGDLSLINSVTTANIDPNSITQSVSFTQAPALNVGLGGGDTNLKCLIKLNITTLGGEVHIEAEILAHITFLIASQPTGTEFGANFALTRGLSSIPITLAGNGGASTTLANYLASGGVALIPSQRGKAFTYNPGSAGSYRSSEDIVSLTHKETPAFGTYTYAVWMGPETADAVAATRTRQFIKLLEVKR